VRAASGWRDLMHLFSVRKHLAHQVCHDDGADVVTEGDELIALG
jgi:hypothetical protein